MAGEIDEDECLNALSSMLADDRPLESNKKIHEPPVCSPREKDTEHRVAKPVHKRRESSDGVVTDKYSGLRIKNPLVSSSLLKQRMEGRKMIRLSQLLGRKEGDIEGDWVTTGVVVNKLPPKDTVKGKKFVVWKLSDLSGQSSVVGLFLFGQAYDAHWKTSEGSVVALLNARIMPPSESGSGMALSLDIPQKLMLLGTSKDFTCCKARCKNGQQCTNFAKLSDGGYCDYHTHSAYKKLRSQRMEFQNGYGPSARSVGLKEKLFKGSKTEVFYYGGQSYSAGSGGGGGSGSSEGGGKKDRAFAPGAKQAIRDRPKPTSTQQGSKLFAEMLQRQSAGARMMRQHLSTTSQATAKLKEGGSGPKERSARQVIADKITGPKLGRGLEPGDKFVPLASPSRAKLKAIAILQSKANQPEQRRETIKRRVEASTGTETPAKKLRREESDYDRIFSAKSSHDWIVQEEESQREEKYFAHLEQKEAVEEKLLRLTELKVSVVQCKQCGYTAQSPLELCTKEKHTLTRFKTVKKCFKCSNCGERAFTYGTRYPATSCAKCGGTSFTAASFHKERAGPKLASEELLIRGREEKFLH